MLTHHTKIYVGNGAEFSTGRERIFSETFEKQLFRDDYFQSLLAERRATTCRHRRAEISKTIRKELRRRLRRQRAQRIEFVLGEFASLNRLQVFTRMPVQSKNLHGESSKPNAKEFAHFLGNIFASEVEKLVSTPTNSGHCWKKRQLADCQT